MAYDSIILLCRLRGGMSSPAGVAVRLGLGVAAAGLLGGLLSRWYKWKPSKKFGEPEEGWKRKTKAEKKLERYLKSKEVGAAVEVGLGRG